MVADETEEADVLGGVLLHEFDEQHPQAGVTERPELLAQGAQLLGIGTLGGEELASDLLERPVGRFVREVGHRIRGGLQANPASMAVTISCRTR